MKVSKWELCLTEESTIVKGYAKTKACYSQAVTLIKLCQICMLKNSMLYLAWIIDGGKSAFHEGRYLSFFALWYHSLPDVQYKKLPVYNMLKSLGSF